MRILVLFLFIISSVRLSFGQTQKIKVFINPGIDSNNLQIHSIIKTWEAYLNSNPDSSYDNPYWLQSEIKKYKSFDLLNHAWFYPSLYYLMQYFKPSILSISEKKDFYVIRTIFANSPKADSGSIQTLAITNVAVVYHNGQFKLCNILPFNTTNWRKEKIDSISFIFPQSHKFNRGLAERLNNFVDSLTAIWKIPIKPIEYYFADDFDVVAKSLGLDYRMGEGNQIKPKGFTDIKNSIVYAGGSNEWYPHEFVHIYINPLFPNSNEYFLEGYATLMGGSGGKSFEWHIKNVNNYLKMHSEMDALNYTGLDNFIGPEYIIGALLCKLALDKGGIDFLKRLMGYGKKEEDLYKAIKDIFNVNKDDVNNFIRNEIENCCRKIK